MKFWMWIGITLSAALVGLAAAPADLKVRTTSGGVVRTASGVVQAFRPADAMATAIIRATTQATGLPNLPAVRDLK